MSADVAEVQSQHVALLRSIREDTAQIQRLTAALRKEITRARMVPIGRLFTRVAQQVREAARAAGKTVTLAVRGESAEVDNSVIEQIADPLLHLIQNAIGHGIEPAAERESGGKPAQGQITLSASQAGGFALVEVEDDGGASLRFGDDEHGQRPDTGTKFDASYRIGNGIIGNVGAESITHIVGAQGDVDRVLGIRNPLPASGGLDPETAESVRRNAPEAFRTQERAVTPEDYAAVTERHSGVQRAAATLRWTGSWYTVFITTDPDAGVDPGPLKQDLATFVDRYRMAGHDLEFNDPIYVPLEIGLHVCVKPDYFRSDVKARLLELFSDRVLPDGRRALFHPDNFTFGQTVYLSPFYAAAHAVPGVASVEIKLFQRQGIDDPTYLANGELPLARLEIARLANNPNFPDRGVLDLEIHGGK